MDQPFYLKQRFSDYQKFTKYADKYKEYYPMSASDSKSHKPSEVDDLDQFPFRYICFVCPRAGIFVSKGKNIRNVKSDKCNCPFFMRLSHPAKKNYYEIRKIICQHNHEGQIDIPENFMDIFQNLYTEIAKTTPSQSVNEDVSPVNAQNLQEQLNIDNELADDGQANLNSNETSKSPLDTKNKSYDDSQPSSSVLQKNIAGHSQSSMSSNNLVHAEGSQGLVGNLANPQANLNLNEIAKSPLDTKVKSCEDLSITEPEVRLLPDADSSLKNSGNNQLRKLRLPLSTHSGKGRGRPRGKVTSAIGLKLKKNPVPFDSLTEDEQAFKILLWLKLEPKFVKAIIDDELVIPLSKIETGLLKISEELTSNFIDLDMVAKFFEASTLDEILKAIATQREDMQYLCRKCSKPVTDDDDCIECSLCLKWIHTKCDRIKITEKMQDDQYKYMCKTCINKK